MGVHPSLPMAGIQVILGNDLAGGRVWPGLSNTLPSKVGAEDPTAPSTVHAACAVTRAMSRTKRESSVKGSEIKGMSVFPVPAFPLPVSCSDLLKEQKQDPTLQALYQQVLQHDEVESAALGYFLQDGLLVRKWCCLPGEFLFQKGLLHD